MKQLYLLAIVFLLPAFAAQADDGELESAQASALMWLSSTDDSQFESSWHAASTFFQAAITESDWVHFLKAARLSFGALKTREIAAATFSRTLPGAADGRYVVFEFDTAFEKNESATETVSMIRDSNDEWRVAGYFIQ